MLGKAPVYEQYTKSREPLFKYGLSTKDTGSQWVHQIEIRYKRLLLKYTKSYSIPQTLSFHTSPH